MGQYSSITREEKSLIHSSWNKVRTDMQKCGTSLFLIVFTDYPKMAHFFPFRKSEDSFEVHVKVFMRELDRLILAIDDPQELNDILNLVAKNHTPRQIGKDDYNKLRASVIKMLKVQLGTDVFQKAMEKAWDKSLNIAFSYLLDTMEKFRNQQQSS